MKKSGKGLLLVTETLLLTALILTGCGKRDSRGDAREGGSEEVLFDVSDSEAPTAEGGVFAFSYTDAHENRIWYYDDIYTVERLADGAWEPVPTLRETDWGVIIYRDIKERSGSRLELDWSERYGALEPGTYSVVKEIYPPRSKLLNHMLAEHVPEESDNLSHSGPDKDFGVFVRAVFELE